MRIALLTITALASSCFMYAQELPLYKQTEHHTDTPRWLHQGMELYLDHYFSDEKIETFKNTATALPTLQELESVEDDERFAELNGPLASYLLVQFIDTQWGREKLFALIDNYADFENILRFTKKNVEKHWMYHTLFTTHAFKSGDPSLASLIPDLLSTFSKALSLSPKNRTAPEPKEIAASFNNYRTKMLESDDHLLIMIQDNTAVAGWALFSLQSESSVLLEAFCIHPDYRNYDIQTKLMSAVHRKVRTIKSITTINSKMDLRTPYFCGAFDYAPSENVD
jgi:hypothetical protein